MIKKVLFCASIQGHIRSFHTPYLKLFKEKGYEVHVIGRDNLSARNIKLKYVDRVYNIDFERSPFKFSNVRIYNQLKSIIKENKYDIIHCHTPMASALTRLAARKTRKAGTKVIYTAHGFHFYQGASMKQWLIYYPIEKWLSCHTDCLIIINKEDFDIAITRRFKAKRIEHIRGVGVDTEKFAPVTESRKAQLRNRANYRKDDFLLFYAAEFNANKNQALLIRTMAKLKKVIPNIKLFLAGTGPLISQCQQLAKNLNISDSIDFLGLREDVNEILPMCDVAVASSLREGLPVNVMEAMAVGLPLVVTDSRGHRDLVEDGENGYIVRIGDAQGFAEAIERLYNSAETRQKFGQKSLEYVKLYSLEKVREDMKEVYLRYI